MGAYSRTGGKNSVGLLKLQISFSIFLRPFTASKLHLYYVGIVVLMKMTLDRQLSDTYKHVAAELRKKIQAVMKEDYVPGLAIALVDKEGIIWTEAIGHTDLSLTRKVNLETLFSLQSTSKSIAAEMAKKASISKTKDGIPNV